MEWYRWFPQLYSDDTLNLSLEQDAIYRRLIDRYMQGRVPLPNNPIALARICQISLEKWQEHSVVVLEFFRLRGDKFHHKRCDIELDRQDGKSKKLSDAAKKSADARAKNKAKTIANEQCLSNSSANAAIEERTGEESNTNVLDSEDAKPAKGKRRVKQQPTTFMSEDFGPDLGSIALAGQLGIDVESSCREFIDYWKGEGRAKSDWQATFRNRLRDIAKYRAEREQRQTNGRSDVRDVTGATLRVVANRMQEKI